MVAVDVAPTTDTPLAVEFPLRPIAASTVSGSLASDAVSWLASKLIVPSRFSEMPNALAVVVLPDAVTSGWAC